MKTFICFIFVLLPVSVQASAADHCLPHEKTVFSFTTKAKKVLSLCKGPSSGYLAYRFGPAEKIEMQFPKQLEGSSWQKFEFSGRKRSGGKANAGFGEYFISFENMGYQYTVFQQWQDEEGDYSIGVMVSEGHRRVLISGLKSTQIGSLVLLEEESSHIDNQAD
jgi:hypothetical protein